MRAHRTTLLAIVFAVSWSATAAAGDIFVICHAPVSLTADEVKDVYFGDKGFAGAVKLAPADNSAQQAAFLDKVMKLDVKKYTGIWIKKAFRDGSAPPPVKATDAEAVAYVKQTAGGCSYVGSAPGDGVVVVAKF
jgi:hypothetical protein